ncbi:MAG: glycosyltransferase family 9 protein [Candidatus Omnitrophica bacterium]|nr:glycosyltransferase family 9 protein [Candidatus Omnitrophota bacterium]
MFQKILIINTFGIGDVLFSTPVISNIKRAFPQTVVHYLTNPRSSAVIKDNPKISKTLIYERDDFHKVYKRSPLEFIKKWVAFFNEIKAEKYDAVLDLSLDRGMGAMCMVAGIKQRIGFNYKNRGLCLTRRIPFKGYEGKHVVDHYLSLLEDIGIPAIDKHLELVIPEADLQWAKDWQFGEALAFSKLLIAVFPGGGASWGKGARFKRWPVEKYVKLVDKMIEKFDAHIILMGNSEERELCNQISRVSPSGTRVVAGDLSLTQSAALLKQCRIAILNDGGPLHVAVASRVTTVSIFGPVDDRVYGPYPATGHYVVKKGLACQPCYRQFRMANCSHVNCLAQLDVDDVLRKVEEVL